MTAHIIHDPDRLDRWNLLQQELAEQGITFVRYWPAIKAEPVQAGISRAHKMIVAHAKKSHWHEVLILEDDVHFTAPGAFAYYMSRVPEDYDIYLGGCYYTSTPEEVVAQFSSTHCWMIHERFYDTLLELDEKVDIDEACANKGRFVVCRPMVAIQHMCYSDHYQVVTDYASMIKGVQLYGL